MKKLFGFGRHVSLTHCGNCGERLGEDDAFCRFCGTERGKGKYRPQKERIECVYGPPPMDRIHHCDNCGFEWTTHTMLDKQKYCPKCGGRALPKEVWNKK